MAFCTSSRASSRLFKMEAAMRRQISVVRLSNSSNAATFPIFARRTSSCSATSCHNGVDVFLDFILLANQNLLRRHQVLQGERGNPGASSKDLLLQLLRGKEPTGGRNKTRLFAEGEGDVTPVTSLEIPAKTSKTPAYTRPEAAWASSGLKNEPEQHLALVLIEPRGIGVVRRTAPVKPAPLARKAQPAYPQFQSAAQDEGVVGWCNKIIRQVSEAAVRASA